MDPSLIHVRWMIRRDMPVVIDIDQRSFEYPWTEEDFIYHLRQCSCIGMVAEIGDRVVGTMVYNLGKFKLDLLTLAVAPELRGEGIGRRLVNKLISKLSDNRRHSIVLKVRETNLDAQLFFKRMGFLATKVLRNECEDIGEDAYVMRYDVREMVEAVQ